MSRAKSQRIKPSAAARVRPFRMVIALAALLCAGGVVFAATWSGFYPKRIVVTGNRSVSTAEILRRAAIAPDRSIWLDDMGAAASRVRAIPYVASASIHRWPPASVTIAVSERVPFAVIAAAGRQAVVDRDLRVLPEAAAGTAPLPLFVLRATPSLLPGSFVTAKDASVLRDAYETMAAKGLLPASLALDRYGDLVATLRDGLHVLLGEPKGLGEKVALAKAILAQVVRAGRRASAVDLRAPSAPVIVYR